MISNKGSAKSNQGSGKLTKSEVLISN